VPPDVARRWECSEGFSGAVGEEQRWILQRVWEFLSSVRHYAVPIEPSPRPVTNQRDGILRRGGDQLMLDVTEKRDGYAAKFDLGFRVRSA